MLSLDISRQSFQRPKNYTGLVWQQGRIPLDSEMNEAGDIAGEELRRAIKDLVCNSGTSDDGFRISGLRTDDDGSVEFDIAAGSYYVGGLRYDLLEASTFLTQPDWLQISLDLDPPPVPPQQGAGNSFIYLEGWEQVVSATEDAECFERALASGADTAGRKRRMARIRYVGESADSCQQSLQDVLGDRTIDPISCAVVTGAGLTVGFDDTGVEEDLCAPQTQEGYLGAENEAFRIQLTAPDRFIYGRDNAAPLYRVQIAAEEVPPAAPPQTRVTFLTRPRDVVSQPLAGQAVELFRWNTRLSNGEKLAEPLGLLANIASDYDPDTASIVIDWELDSDWLSWFGGAGAGTENPLDDPDLATYFFLRVWTGGSGDPDAPDHLIIPGPIALPGTGLEVTFAAANTPGTFGDPGEFWVAAARPNAPDVITPWRLMEASAETPPPSPPMGPMRHLAPLALVTWTAPIGSAPQGTASDCRERFRKLCMQPTCCEITVGDGMRSFGDVNDIAEAVARLPVTGGKICLLRGLHTASVDLTGRTDIRFSGCGPETIWQADDSQDTIPAAALLARSQRIKFSDFVMRAADRDVVLAGSRLGTSGRGRCREITFRNMVLQGRDRSVLWLNACDELRIESCRIGQEALTVPRTVDATSGTDPAIFALGDTIHVEHCEIGVDIGIPAEIRPLGGLTLGGTTRNATVRDNRIIGGKGNGITLGHLEWLRADGGFTGFWTLGPGFLVNDAGCLTPNPIPIPPDPGDGSDPDELIPVSGGELRALTVDGNHIANMGLNGIAVAHFFDLELTPDFISVSDIRIAGNEITRCLRTDLNPAPLSQRFFQGHGGIALAACDLIDIDGNAIHDNGIELTAPVAGIFLLYVAGAQIRNNRIHGNGTSALDGGVPELGRRGGVVIGWAQTFANAPASSLARAVPPRLSALEMTGNFVDSTHGRALKVTALGAVRVCDNRLFGAGDSGPEFAQLGAALNITPQISGFAGILAGILSLDPIVRRDFADDDLILSELLAAVLGGNAVSILNLAFLEELVGGLDDDITELSDAAMGGETMFDNNQVSFRPHSLAAVPHVSAVFVGSLDDVSVCNNQIECETGFGFVMNNAMALGSTLRMQGNRMQEQLGNTLFSGYTHALLLNTTVANQGTHCFAATTFFPASGANRINEANLSLIENFPGAQGFCGRIDDYVMTFDPDQVGDNNPPAGSDRQFGDDFVNIGSGGNAELLASWRTWGGYAFVTSSGP